MSPMSELGPMHIQTIKGPPTDETMGKPQLINPFDIHEFFNFAHENGIDGLVAYTSPGNKGMISLFKTLPYKNTSSYDGDVVELKCLFSEPLD